MLNILRGYIENSLPRQGALETRPGLRVKVDDHGQFLPFVGNTIVFELDTDTKQAIAPLQKRLYANAEHLLAERLSPDTFHLTLHDLANGTPNAATQAWMEQTEPAARAILTRIKSEHAAPLAMKTSWIFNMVNTSIVLGAEPADEESRERLIRMYTLLNEVVPLNYALTPHITLAYFRPGLYSQAELEPLRQALTPVALTFSLRMENLILQNFSDMNHYKTI